MGLSIAEGHILRFFGATKFKIIVILVVVLALGLAFSGIAGVTAVAEGVSAPRGLTLSEPDSSLGGCIKLAWSHPDLGEVHAFRVYRGEGWSGKLELLSEQPLWDRIDGSRLEHVDTELDPGSYYRYAISVVGLDGREGTRSQVAGMVAPGPKGGYRATLAGKRIIISIADQTVYFLEDEHLIKKHLISTGVDAYPTPTGVFSILYHEYLLI